jgi:hypothetical protein
VRKFLHYWVSITLGISGLLGALFLVCWLLSHYTFVTLVVAFLVSTALIARSCVMEDKEHEKDAARRRAIARGDS